MPVILYLEYIPIWNYSADNPENFWVDIKDEQTYGKIHITD